MNEILNLGALPEIASGQDIQNLSRTIPLDAIAAPTQALDFSILPSAATPAWTVTVTGFDGIVESDCMAIASNELTIDTTAIPMGTAHYGIVPTAPAIDFTAGFTAAFKLQVLTSAAADSRLAFKVYDPGTGDYAYWYFSTTEIKTHIGARGASTTISALVDTTVENEYRITILGTVTKLFINEKLVLVATTIQDPSPSFDAIYFGDLDAGAGANSKSVWSSFAWKAAEVVDYSTSVQITADRMAIGAASDDSVDLTISTGTAAGALGIDTGAFATGKWYRIWVLNGFNGTTAVLSLSNTFAGVTKPAGYSTNGRMVGSVMTDATTATHLCRGCYLGDFFFWETAKSTAMTTPSAGWTFYDMGVVAPPGAEYTRLILDSSAADVYFGLNYASPFMYVSSPCTVDVHLCHSGYIGYSTAGTFTSQKSVGYMERI